ncbi:MAG: hypothetical protein AVDCRST_MAG74-2368, partial [uncultured Pyrinomonadaceae bacterium]
EPNAFKRNAATHLRDYEPRRRFALVVCRSPSNFGIFFRANNPKSKIQNPKSKDSRCRLRHGRQPRNAGEIRRG